jgi:hypothetical protein
MIHQTLHINLKRWTHVTRKDNPFLLHM